MPKHLKLLRKLLLRERNMRLLATMILMAMGLFGVVLMCYAKNVRLAVLSVSFGMLLLIISFKFLYETIGMWQPENTAIWRQVTVHPEEIVWVYSRATMVAPFGVQMTSNAVFFLKLLDGREWSMSIPYRSASRLSLLLNEVLPQATFGYSVEKAQWYLVDPHLLRRG